MKAVDELFQPSQGNTERQTPLTSSGSLINLTRMSVDGGRNRKRTHTEHVNSHRSGQARIQTRNPLVVRWQY